jgi:hypothetical protein
LAEHFNGIDLSHRQVGDVMDLPAREGEILIASGWGIAARSSGKSAPRRAEAHNRPTPRKPKRRT